MTDANGLTKTLSDKLVVAGKVTVATHRLKSASVGNLYRLKLRARGGARPYRWSIASGKLPRGIKLNRRTGWLTGTAQTAGSYRFEIALKDGLGGETTHAYKLTVN